MSSRYYQFGEFRLDADARRLMKGDCEVALAPKAFDTLLELVRSNGRLLERDELMRRIWPDSFVEEGNIKVTIFNLRKALEDNQGESQMIQTVPRRGYRFAAQVTEIDDHEKKKSDAGTSVRSLVVLPFKLMGGIEDDYLGFGLADAIIIKLSALKEIVVRPTSAVRRYIGSDRSTVEIARELGVEAALEGNMYRSGDRIRVTAQLITVNDSKPLWGDKFDERFTDIFDVEDSISEQVAQALTLKLTGHDRGRLTRRYTENIEAYQLYLKGRYYWAKRTSEATRMASQIFREAIDRDPNYTLAYAGLADCYAQLAWLTFLAPHDALPIAKGAAVRALELDPLLAEAHASLAWISLIYDLDYDAAEASFKRALELNPNYSVARMWFGVFLISIGQFSNALEQLRHALKLDPLSPIINAIAGWPLYFMRDYGAALDSCKKAIELEPKSLPAHFLLGLTYCQTGVADEAVNAMKTARELDNSCLTTSGLAQAYAVKGSVGEAEELVSELQRAAKERSQYVSPYDLAGVYLRLGDHNRTIKMLENAFEDHSTWRIFLPVDPKFDGLRSDGRFQGLLRKMTEE